MAGRLRCGIVLFLTLVCRAQERPSTPEFEVASVKAARPNAQYANIFRGGPGTSDPETFTVESVTLKGLIQGAYRLRPFQVSGPAWIDNTRYDVLAKVPSGATKADRDLMLQSLLAERFALKFHNEKKAHPAYELVADKRGFKLKPSTKEPDIPELNKSMLAITGQRNFFGIYPARGGTGISGASMPVDAFAGVLESQLDGDPILDKTGLSGLYDFQVEFAPAGKAGDSSLPSLFTAVEECCGLKLQPVKTQFDVMVIDHVEPPSEN